MGGNRHNIGRGISGAGGGGEGTRADLVVLGLAPSGMVLRGAQSYGPQTRIVCRPLHVAWGGGVTEARMVASSCRATTLFFFSHGVHLFVIRNHAKLFLAQFGAKRHTDMQLIMGGDIVLPMLKWGNVKLAGFTGVRRSGGWRTKDSEGHGLARRTMLSGRLQHPRAPLFRPEFELRHGSSDPQPPRLWKRQPGTDHGPPLWHLHFCFGLYLLARDRAGLTPGRRATDLNSDACVTKCVHA